MCTVADIIYFNCVVSYTTSTAILGLSGALIFLWKSGYLAMNRTFKTLLTLCIVKSLGLIGNALTVQMATRTQEMVAIIYPDHPVLNAAKSRVIFLLIVNGICSVLVNASAGLIIIIFTSEYLGVAQILKDYELKREASKNHGYCLEFLKWGGIITTIVLCLIRSFLSHRLAFYHLSGTAPILSPNI